MKPADYSEVTTRLKQGLRKLDDALLERDYDMAKLMARELNGEVFLLTMWLGGIKDGQFVSA